MIKKRIADISTQFQHISDTPTLDAEILLAHAISQSRTFLFTHPEYDLSEDEIQTFTSYCDKRKQGVPIAYIIGEKEFWDITLKVTEDVLIPRPETESIVAWVLEHAKMRRQRLLDLGTGSGAIAIAIAKARPSWRLCATDNSDKALAIAKENAEQYGLENIDFIQSNWYDNINPTWGFDFIVSNPPYVTEAEYQSNVDNLKTEPKGALVSSHQGLADLEKIITKAASYLYPQGWIVLEHGFEQGAGVRDLLNTSGFQQIETLKDLAGLDRTTLGQKP